MTPAMLAIDPSSSSEPTRITPNLLPCKLHHNGPIKVSKTHWNPSTSSDRTHKPVAHLRGRRLLGRRVKLPRTYEGIVLQKTDKVHVPNPAVGETGDDDQDEDEDEKPIEVKMMEEKGRFEEVMVWGHDIVPGDEDVYVKGIEEWIGFAEVMHKFDGPAPTTTTGS